jgi:hypothetical protein
VPAAPEGSAPDAGETHGALRDAVASLQNLHSLLRSAKVGPRAIAAVLPEIRGQLSPLAGQVGAMLADASSGGGCPEAQALSQYTSARLTEAARLVERAEGSELDAKSRLSFEAEVGRLTPLIEASRGLIELLFASLERPVELDLSELLEAALCTSSQRIPLAGPMVTVLVELPRRGCCPLLASPRVAVPLYHLAIAHAATESGVAPSLRAGVKAPVLRLMTRRQPAGDEPAPHGERVVVEVGLGSTASRGDALSVRHPVLIEPTAAVVQLVVSRCGGSATFEAGDPDAVVALPAACDADPSTGRAG